MCVCECQKLEALCCQPHSVVISYFPLLIISIFAEFVFAFGNSVSFLFSVCLSSPELTLPSLFHSRLSVHVQRVSPCAHCLLPGVALEPITCVEPVYSPSGIQGLVRTG